MHAAVSTYAVVILAILFLPGFRAQGTPGQSMEEARKHWAYQPLRTPRVPTVKAKGLVQTPIDAFLLSKLEAKGLGFAPRADKEQLLRRVYYDLIGLPPSFEEREAFRQNRAADAWDRTVERLLASPSYGERWGRHWLDIARYADTKDLVLTYGKDALRPYAYTYRDYVIRAFNEDLPYDQFVQDQLAADLVQPRVPQWRLAALGFLTLGRLFDNNIHDQIDDQIDTVSRGFLALTVACARCHDHKYDAIWQSDYYGLYGVFASTERPYELPLLENPTNVPGGVQFEEQLSKARAELENLLETEYKKLSENFRLRIGDYLVRAATTKPDITETTQFGLSLTPENFRPALVQRTRRLLQERLQTNDHVFGPWATLQQLPEADFGAGAKKLSGEWLSQAKSGGQGFNVLVLQALEHGVMTNKDDISRIYGETLVKVYERSKKDPAIPRSADEKELLDLVISKESPVWFARRDTPEHLSRPEADQYGKLVGNLDKIAAQATNAPPARAMVVADLPEAYEPHVFKRGNPSRPGEAVPRSFVRVLTGGEPQAFRKGSGRLELAQAIVAPNNPLTARVLVNRIWMWHFGEPLVGSATDFGVRSTPPANPELMDWLATELIRSGWSIKHLQRIILASAAYQQSSAATAGKKNPGKGASAGEESDPENKLLSHFSRRRLDFEAMRDSLLAISGRLDPTVGGRPVDIAAEPLNARRTVYGLVDRQNLPAVFRAFDFPVPDQCIERRAQTSVPQQALFALNSPFILEQARAVVARPECGEAKEASARVEALFRRILGRNPSKKEVAAALRFTSEGEKSETGTWEQLAQVLMISNESVFVD